MEGDGGSTHASRIVALVNQAQTDRLEGELRPFSPMFTSLADKLTAIFASFSTGSTKCSVWRLGLEEIDTEELKPHGRIFRSAAGEFRLFLRAEKAFDSLVCEVCFGGADTELHHSEESNRPQSRIEQFLRNLVFDSLHAALPEMVKDIAGVVLEPVEAGPDKKQGSARSALKAVSVTFLVNAFSLSAEVDVLVPLLDMEAVFGATGKRPGVPGRSVAEVLSECPFELVASLAPQDIGLDSIISLEVGNVLKLRTTPAHPSLLHVEGVEIGRCRLNITSQEIAVSLI